MEHSTETKAICLLQSRGFDLDDAELAVSILMEAQRDGRSISDTANNMEDAGFHHSDLQKTMDAYLEALWA